MNIGIIGAGKMGSILARHLAKLGHQVSIANSRGPQSLTSLAADLGANPVSLAEAVRDKDIVVMAIPTKVVVELPRNLFANVPESTIIVEIGNYHPELRDGRIEAIERGLPDSKWVSEQIGCPVIKAFNNILDQSLLTKGKEKGAPDRIALSVAGDSAEAKLIVMRLIDDIGFDPINVGGLDESWRQQTGTPAYCKDLSAAELQTALAEAEQNRVTDYRAREEARIKRLIVTNAIAGA